MKTNAPGKGEQGRQPSAGRSTEDMQTAYQIHTLAHMLYGQFAATHPWIFSTPQATGFPPVSGFETLHPTRTWPGAHPFGSQCCYYPISWIPW